MRKKRAKMTEKMITPDFIDLFSADITFYLTTKDGSQHECPAHLKVLQAKSSVFGKMFSSEMSEKETRCVNIAVDNSEDFVSFLEYFYKETVSITDMTSLMQVLDLAEQYEVAGVSNKICQSVLGSSEEMWNDKIEVIFNFCMKDTAKYHKALNKILMNLKPYKEFIQKEIFLTIPYKAAIVLVMRMNDDTDVDRINLFKGFSTWCLTNIKKSEQRKVFSEFIEHVDISTFHLDELIDIVYPTNLVDNADLFEIVVSLKYKRVKKSTEGCLNFNKNYKSTTPCHTCLECTEIFYSDSKLKLLKKT